MPTKPARTGKKIKKGMRRIIYSLGFLLYFYTYLLIYINSSFLAQFVGERNVGLVFTLGSILSIGLFLITPLLLEKFGNVRVAIVSIALLFLSTLGLVYTEKTVFIILFFFGTTLLFRLASYSFDLFLEHESSDEETGSIRGIFLTITSMALVLAPLITGFIIGNEDLYERAYLIAALLLLPILFFISVFFRNFKDPIYGHFSFLKTGLQVWKNKDLRSIVASNFILRIFYATMVIYTPIYLHEHVGFGWETLGIIFTIMLIPFVLLELPLGALADKKMGEKELLTFGFVWTALSTFLLSVFTEPSFWIWAGLLFSTRIGASVIEIMTETYFFKQIKGEDNNVLGFFRTVQPLAYVVTPVVAGVFLYFFDFRWLFIPVGLIVLYGATYSLSLKDTL